MIDINDPEVIESLKYLLVPQDERIKNSATPFDAKKACWVPNKEEGYLAGEIQSTKGDEVTVKTSKGESVTLKKDDVQSMNPPKYDKTNDMADLTHLNDASVLANLRQRYKDWLIYTYSGLFCVTINPYKRLPVYTMKMVYFYRGKKKTEVPPHLYSIADNAYANMLRERDNQSMLITGESGAGKTENTKKVIQYFAFVASTGPPRDENAPKEASLEDQIVSANPVLEAYGNAKTTRNNNSSRFGKFIRIHFGPAGKIAGADIEAYLLEKSRINYQMPAERNYHIFYQLLTPAFPEYHKMMLVETDPTKYFNIAQGKVTVDGIDDNQEFKDCNEAFAILNFANQDKEDCFKATAAVMMWGNAKFKQRPREEQAEPDGTEECEKVAHLLGIECADLIKGLTKPRIKVGNEFVNKGQNMTQVVNSIGALCKSLYSRIFQWLVNRVNETLDVKTKRAFFIGVLDIAGFEIFEENGFEQICINYTNERLQQFFNHHMFVVEQEEYKKEGIQWEMMNFGLDLQACIELIEKPLGIMSILEEECIVPKASDKTFQEKLYNQHLGKHPNFGKPKPQKGKAEAHFDLHHYAGTVSYSITGWLEKNKDPINTTVATLFKFSKTNGLISRLYQDMGVEEEKGGGGRKKGKGGMQTISSGHRDQLNKLMNTLKQTSPHFVRCIIPNEIKTGGILDAHLVMHQLTCNGVLEGIRICRKGFPNRVIFSEFKQRYSILAPNAVGSGFVDATKATSSILKDIALDEALYRIGNTKVFFKAGVMGQLEELRDTAVCKIISMLQSHIRLFVMKKQFKRMLDQRLALSVLQRNVKKYLTLRNWGWWKLYTNIKPLLSNANAEEERKAKEEEMRLLQEEQEKKMLFFKELEENNLKLVKEKTEMYTQLQEALDQSGEAEDRIQKLILQKADMESQIKESEARLQEEEAANTDVANKKRRLEGEINEVKRELDEAHAKITKNENDNKNKETSIHKLQDEMAQQDETIAKLTREKKRLDETNNKTGEALQQEEDKVNHLNKVKSKLEQSLDESEDSLEREKKGRADLDKAKRKLEADLKQSQATTEEVERLRKDLEDNLKRKDSEILTMSNKIEDEHSQAINFSKKVKELQQRLDEAVEESEHERQGRTKAEKQRADLSRELDELSERLEEAGGATSAQLDLNKKREAELAKLRRDLEDANIQHEATAAQLRKKHQDAVNEMGEQIDLLQKAKNKLEKDKQLIKSEVDEARLQTEHANKARANVEKVVKQLEIQITEVSYKFEDSQRLISELSSQKNKLQSENVNLLTSIEDAESHINGFAKVKQQLQAQIEEAKRIAEDETRARNGLAQQLRNTQHDLEAAREQAEEEHEARSELQKTVSKVTSEMMIWRSKYESEGLARAEELEEAKRKLAIKLQEAEEQVEQALARCNSLEKTKQRLQIEVEDLMVDVERANNNAATMEKKQRQFDKLIAEWKQKCEDITIELESSQKEARQYSTEVFKLRTQYEESHESIEALRRENKNLADEIKDLMDQLSEGGKSVHELEKSRKRLEIEKEELQAALEEAESALEQEEAKVLRAQLELSQVRQEIDRRLQEKEEEFENTRRNHQRALESMQASLEAETKGKIEAIRQKKKLEGDINELEISLDHANRANADLQKLVKKLQINITELHVQIEDEQRQRDEAREAAASAERQCNILISELEEIRVALEQAERARKAAENDLHDAADRISELSASNANLGAQKRKLEGELAGLQADLDEAIAELKNSEERVKKASADAARLAEELRCEQEHALNIDKLRKTLEQQVKDLQVRLDEAEANALKGGKRIIQKLEQRIHELESELDLEQRHHQETLKEVRKNDRRLKELVFAAEEDRKNQARLQDLVEKLQNKLKVYKRQVEEAEEIAAVNLAKFRKVQHELEDAEERADQAENQVNKQRAKNRSTVSCSRGGSPVREQQTRAQSHVPQRAGSVFVLRTTSVRHT